MVRPNRNLPPESEPWGRLVDTELDQLKFQADQSAQGLNNTLLSINGTLTQLSSQVAAIAATAAAANAAANTAAAAAATANANTAALAVEVARINALVAAQVDGATGTNSASVGLNTTPTGHAPITFTVPSGYTRAKVMGVSAMYMGGTVASILRTQINGANGPDMYAFTNSAYANATAVHAADLSGLTGGVSFVVQALANTTTSSTSGVINTAAIVTWLK